MTDDRKNSVERHPEPGPQHPLTPILLWLRNAAVGTALLYVSFRYLLFACIEKSFTSYGSGAAITQVCLVWSLVVAALLPLSRRLPRALRITKRDLAFLFIFLFLGGPMMLGSVYFTKMTTYAHYEGMRNPNTKLLLEEQLPRLAPSDEGITSLYKGSPDGSIDWASWFSFDDGIAPALVWGLFALFLVGTCFSLMFLFSRRWLEDEQLAFPLARFGELLVDGHRSLTTGDRLPLLSARAFWVGFTLTFLFQLCTYLSPGLEHRLGSFYIPDTTPVLGCLDYSSRQFWWRPVFLAMFFLCPRRILGSALLFHVLICGFTIVGCSLGYQGYTASELPGASPFPFKQDQLIGGAIAMVLIVLWLSRRYLAAQGRGLVRWLARRDCEQGQDGRPVALLVFVLSVGGFTAWTLIAGFRLNVVLLFLGCVLLGVVMNTRGRAETGMPMILVFSGFTPLDMVSIAGTKLIGLKTIAGTVLHGWVFWNNLLHVTPSFMDALKMGQLLRRSYRWVCGVAVAGLVIGVLLGIVVVFDSAYDMGINNWAYKYGSGSFQSWTATQLMQKDVGFNWVHGGYALAGAGLVAGLWICRISFPGFALHPMGYLLCLHPGLHHFSLSLIIAYAVKTLTIHYGGMKVYTPLVPFFVGLLVGQVSGGVLGGILNWILGTAVYMPMV